MDQALPSVVGQFTDSELFEIVDHGVKYSAMPSWPTQARDDEVWSMVAFLRQLPAGVPLLWVGLGSNLLVRDGGIRGAVISTQAALGLLERMSATRIHVEAGGPCARLARQCVKWGMGPAEFFAGIPGTLGGALAMNAWRGFRALWEAGCE